MHEKHRQTTYKSASAFFPPLKLGHFRIQLGIKVDARAVYRRGHFLLSYCIGSPRPQRRIWKICPRFCIPPIVFIHRGISPQTKIKMKKILCIALFCSLCCTSCFRTKVYIGSARPSEPTVKVASEPFNAHFIGGLVASNNSTMQTGEYVNDAENFVAKTNLSFVNMLIGSLTCGIYTPTQTVYYLPVEEIGKSYE